MIVEEITLKVYLLKDIHKEHTLEKIGELLDNSLSCTEKFQKFHETNKFKNYTFNSFYQLEEGGIYKEGKIYSVKIRTIDEELAKYFKKNLFNEYTDHIKGLTIESKELRKKPIEKIYSITPIVMKTDNGYWKGNLSLEEFETRLKENLIKKYNYYFDTKIDEEFELFNRIEFNNRKPIATSYKNIRILGDKLTLYIAENDISQNLAYLALGAGLGEMNARGYGYVNYKTF